LSYQTLLAGFYANIVAGFVADIDRQNVGKAMAKVLHAVCLRIWEPDFFFNLMVVEKLSSKVHPEKFGYRHTDIIFEADTRPDWGPENECEIVNWKSQAEELEGYPLRLAF
jgi:hypothetical protein